jgi:ABC-type multidrug transport system permease subunit
MRWEPLLLAVILLVISFFAVKLLFGPTIGPARRGSSKYSATATFVWKNFPAVYRFYEKTLLLLWIVLMLIGTVYCVKLTFTG